jgi:hypothetical protein
MSMDLFYSPVRRTALVRSRLEVDVPSRTDESVDWDEVTRAILDTLQQLQSDVHARDATVVTKQGTTRGGVIELFAYCSFELPSSTDVEPVVAGVTIQRDRPDRLSLSGDVCGDESGRIYAREDPVTVDQRGTESLTRAAERLAAHVARRVDEVLAAVRSSTET